MSQSGSNPLFVHGIVMFVVALAIVVAGILGIVDAAKAKAESSTATSTSSSAGGVTGTLTKAQKTESDIRNAKSEAARLTTAPTSISGALSSANSAKSLAGKAGQLKGLVDFLVPIAIIAVGIGTGVAGLFLLKQSNWARHVSFAILSLTLLYCTYLMSARNAARAEVPEGQPGPGELLNDFNVIWPIGLTLISILAGKFLWDLFVEKFDAPPAAA